MLWEDLGGMTLGPRNAWKEQHENHMPGAGERDHPKNRDHPQGGQETATHAVSPNGYIGVGGSRSPPPREANGLFFWGLGGGTTEGVIT